MDVRRPDIQRRRYRRFVTAGVAVLALAALVWVAFGLAARPPAVASDGLWSARLTHGEFVHEITGAGTLVAPELRAVTTRSDGVVERVKVLPGVVVGPDDVLITMSSPQLEEDLADAIWDLESAKADEVQQRVDLNNRFLELVSVFTASEAEYTSARLERGWAV